MLELQQNLGPGTVRTTYTDDDADQLDMAQQVSTTWQYTYNANGNLISDDVKSYTYDSANRLIQVTDRSVVTNLSYRWQQHFLSVWTWCDWRKDECLELRTARWHKHPRQLSNLSELTLLLISRPV